MEKPSPADIPLAQQDTVHDDTECSLNEADEPLPKDTFLLKTAEELGQEALCFQCGQRCPLHRVVLKTKSRTDDTSDKYICKQCNSVKTMLHRHLKWPPEEFSTLTEAEQEGFWRSCHETADPAGRFKYDLIRAKLVKRMVFRLTHSQTAEEWSEAKPLSVWQKEGWDVSKIEAVAKKSFNTVAGWVYEVPVIRTSRKVTLQEIEERINESEQAIKLKTNKGESATFMETAGDETEPKPKKPKVSKNGDAAALKKELAEVRKHNAKAQVLANKALNILTKPVEEINKAFDVASRNETSLPALLMGSLRENNEKVSRMLKNAASIVKAAPNALAKNIRLEELDWDSKAATLAVAECKADLKQFNALARALKLT